jgi:hypothetical protein
MQVIGLLVPDPPIFGEELRVQQSAGEAAEDGNKNREKNYHLPLETYPFLGSNRAPSAHCPGAIQRTASFDFAHRIRLSASRTSCLSME